MAGGSLTQEALSLRALNYRVSSCPPEKICLIAPQIAASLWNCRAILSASSDSVKVNSEASQTVNRFRTSLSQLLQARSVEERWAAVVLAKAAVEAGGPEIVRKATGWTKNLIAMLKRNDPPTTKVLAIVTLTRVFMLTWEDPNLVREITTPALPGFVQGCLTAVEKEHTSGKVLQTVLDGFATLVPRHPTIFRTYETQIRALLVKILSATVSASGHERRYTEDHHALARRLFVLLHYCAPKQGGSEKWDETLAAAVKAAHSTCDHVFRSVNESWKPGAGATRTNVGAAGGMQTNEADAAGLTPWQGMHAGCERVATLLRFLQAHFECTTSSTTAVRLGLVIDLLSRVLELDISMRDQAASFNARISKDEREELFSILPSLHTAALTLVQRIVQRLGRVSASTLARFIDMLSSVFAFELADVTLRTTSYQVLNGITKLIGPSLSKDSILDITPIIRACCEDLLPGIDIKDQTKPDLPTNSASPHHQAHSARLCVLRSAASALLPNLFAKLDQSLLPAKLRIRMEQTAILTRHKDALVACVLNPLRKKRDTALTASLLPLLAREFPDCMETEALLRPRMPVVVVSGGDGRVELGNGGVRDEEEGDESSGEDDEDEDDIDMQDGSGVTAAHDSGEAAVPPTTAHGSNGPADSKEAFAFTGAGPPDGISCMSLEDAYDAGSSRQSNKRPAADTTLPAEANAKRLRPSPIAASINPESEQSLPAPDPATAAAAGAPVPAVPTDDPGEAQPVVLPAPKATAKEEGGGDSDDSDFEIPPLTMESDSEDEVVGVEGEGVDGV